jgi:hypothetical protein
MGPRGRSCFEYLPPPDWTQRPAYRAALAELERMCRVEARREEQLIQEAEHAAELEFLRRKTAILAKEKES